MKHLLVSKAPFPLAQLAGLTLPQLHFCSEEGQVAESRLVRELAFPAQLFP